MTRVKEKPEIQSTVFFPNLKDLGWKENKKSALQKENGLSYRFTEWVRE